MTDITDRFLNTLAAHRGSRPWALRGPRERIVAAWQDEDGKQHACCPLIAVAEDDPTAINSMPRPLRLSIVLAADNFADDLAFDPELRRAMIDVLGGKAAIS